jgi:hypothetical protein
MYMFTYIICLSFIELFPGHFVDCLSHTTRSENNGFCAAKKAGYATFGQTPFVRLTFGRSTWIVFVKQSTDWVMAVLAKCLSAKCLSAKCLLAKCLLAKCLSAKCLSAKCLSAKCLFAKCLSAKCLSAKCLSAKCLSAKCLSAKCLSAKCLSAKCYSTKVLILS